ncbi:MAG: MerR family transcriptional regulator [Patescibacteria group bacterium]
MSLEKCLFTPKEVGEVVGVSYRQIRYWGKTGFIKPTAMRNGKHRLFTKKDVCLFAAAKHFREHYSIPKLRGFMQDIAQGLRDCYLPLPGLVILIQGGRAFVISGQVVGSFPGTHVFSLAPVCETIKQMYPDTEDGLRLSKSLRIVGPMAA